MIHPGDNILEMIRPEIKDYWQVLNDDIFKNGAKTIQYELDGRFFRFHSRQLK